MILPRGHIAHIMMIWNPRTVCGYDTEDVTEVLPGELPSMCVRCVDGVTIFKTLPALSGDPMPLPAIPVPLPSADDFLRSG